MTAPLNQRSLDDLIEELKKLKGVHQRCSEIFKDIPTEHTNRALERIREAIDAIEQEIARRIGGP